jgi:hypothetical protein
MKKNVLCIMYYKAITYRGVINEETKEISEAQKYESIYETRKQYVLLFEENVKNSVYRKYPSLKDISFHVFKLDRSNLLHRMILALLYLLKQYFDDFSKVSSKTVVVTMYYRNKNVGIHCVDFENVPV